MRTWKQTPTYFCPLQTPNISTIGNNEPPSSIHIDSEPKDGLDGVIKIQESKHVVIHFINLIILAHTDFMNRPTK